MSVLVTGGAGYIGSHMVLELLDAGEKVVVLDNLSTGFRWAVPADVPFVTGDFGDAALVKETLARYDVNAIAHFAAKIVVPESVADPLGYYLNNTAKARSLIQCAVEAKVPHFIFSSTAAVYGDPESNPVTESESLKPVSPYGRSKLMVEWMLEDVAKAHGLHYAVLRYFNVAGADPKGRVGQSTANATHLIKVAVQAALGHRAGMEVFGTDYPTRDGSCLRDYIQVSDLAAAHMDALRYLRAGGDSITCNCGYARGYSVLEVIDVVKKVSGVDFPVTISGRRAGDPAAIVAANDRVRAVLGWTPQYDDLEVIVRQALHWERHLQQMRADAAAPGN
ncbi:MULTISPECIES: UDP-glucose 4-epimerase GalE [unclassified Beijerinckia]|uniref:UDP-glucose 4-epimerase GalE n=1 Tax=unclassified Beijerinckia TaxID=2638183 RepID=UPI000895F014|nr:MULTISPECIES: UDP-glucose 4-epimerase GalE [unclassified Beijerinckia]MDH7798793.1 UDP-glucose 4-epimerase [Beijerinckia sp. GAS462]SED33418.1 UDP-galactose 4-epimerase [Beijerinckia sp. 28-YEA-48]